jgi:hypothetical protein
MNKRHMVSWSHFDASLEHAADGMNAVDDSIAEHGRKSYRRVYLTATGQIQ